MTAYLFVNCALPLGSPTSFPCVDCGLLTGNFCDGSPRTVGYNGCLSSNRVPKDFSSEVYGGMCTPLCSYCETCFDYCRFCREVAGCTPPNRNHHWSGIPLAESRDFTEAKSKNSMTQAMADEVDQKRQDEFDEQMQQHHGKSVQARYGDATLCKLWKPESTKSSSSGV